MWLEARRTQLQAEGILTGDMNLTAEAHDIRVVRDVAAARIKQLGGGDPDDIEFASGDGKVESMPTANVDSNQTDSPTEAPQAGADPNDLYGWALGTSDYSWIPDGIAFVGKAVGSVFGASNGPESDENTAPPVEVLPPDPHFGDDAAPYPDSDPWASPSNDPDPCPSAFWAVVEKLVEDLHGGGANACF